MMEKLKLNSKKKQTLKSIASNRLVVLGDIHAGIEEKYRLLENVVVMGDMVDFGYVKKPSKWQAGFSMIHGNVSPGVEPLYSVSYTVAKTPIFLDIETSSFGDSFFGKPELNSIQIENKIKDESYFRNHFLGEWNDSFDYKKGVFPRDLMGRKEARQNLGLLEDLRLHTPREIELFKNCDNISKVIELLPHTDSQGLVTYILKESLDPDVSGVWDSKRYKHFISIALRKITNLKYLDFLLGKCDSGKKNNGKSDSFRMLYDHPKPILELALIKRIELLKDSPSIRFIMES